MSIILRTTTTSGGQVVDLTEGHNCTVKRSVNNPVIVFSIPKIWSGDPDAESTANQIVINLGMLTDRFTLNFDLTDGIGDGSDYRKLLMMATWCPYSGLQEEGLISFTYGDSTYTVTVEQFDAETRPGELNMLRGCSITLINTNKLSYGFEDLI